MTIELGRDRLIQIIYFELLDSDVDADDLLGLAAVLADAIIVSGWPVVVRPSHDPA